ncbi:hypothetical protein F2Q68_00033716 [Brassica cretica]|uniref:Uncharacterized protein n=1 Tax=Brassica cretica TaxID=69181 RepID=A0A8S9H0U1_BRACR|nr:hypothetical protein F2Q68_00033716 [Brassica cretica]
MSLSYPCEILALNRFSFSFPVSSVATTVDVTSTHRVAQKLHKAVDISELRLLLDKTHKSNKKEVVYLDITHHVM